jgi:hypothetical protein
LEALVSLARRETIGGLDRDRIARFAMRMQGLEGFRARARAMAMNEDGRFAIWARWSSSPAPSCGRTLPSWPCPSSDRSLLPSWSTRLLWTQRTKQRCAPTSFSTAVRALSMRVRVRYSRTSSPSAASAFRRTGHDRILFDALHSPGKVT